jgi:magnesium transporter
VLHVPEMAGDDVEVGEIDIFVGPNYILSVRQRTQHGFGEVRARAEGEPELLKHGSGFVFYALMDNVVDRYFPLVDQLEVELEKIEERIFAGNSAKANIQALYELKHKGMTIRHAVEPLIEAVHKLYGGRVPQVCIGTQDYFRDVYDHLLRVSQQLDGLRDMVITALSVNLSMITMSTGEITKRLAAYGALVAIPTLIAGVYGMNFKNMPELDWVWGYPVTLAMMVGLDGLLFFRFRKAGWL